MPIRADLADFGSFTTHGDCRPTTPGRPGRVPVLAPFSRRSAWSNVLLLDTFLPVNFPPAATLGRYTLLSRIGAGRQIYSVQGNNISLGLTSWRSTALCFRDHEPSRRHVRSTRLAVVSEVRIVVGRIRYMMGGLTHVAMVARSLRRARVRKETFREFAMGPTLSTTPADPIQSPARPSELLKGALLHPAYQ